MVTDKRDEMLSLNAVRCVAILLTIECETAGIIKSTGPVRETEGLKKSQEELITGILKCLGYFTTYSTAQCAEQVIILRINNNNNHNYLFIINWFLPTIRHPHIPMRSKVVKVSYTHFHIYGVSKYYVSIAKI